MMLLLQCIFELGDVSICIACLSNKVIYQELSWFEPAWCLDGRPTRKAVLLLHEVKLLWLVEEFILSLLRVPIPLCCPPWVVM